MTRHAVTRSPRTSERAEGTRPRGATAGRYIAIYIAAALLLSAVCWPAIGRTAEKPASPPSQQVVATDVQAADGVVSGKIVNRSDVALRDVRLTIDHTWLWSDERRPGKNNPSRTDFYTLPQVVPPHGSVAFQYRTTPPLPQRQDGHFRPVVNVVGFTEVGS